MSIIYTGGTFDLFHEGHLELLEACHRLAGKDGRVIVALNTDEFIERFKFNRPIMAFAERKKMLEACKYVDYVVPNVGEENSTITIDKWNKDNYPIDVVAIGSDWAGRDYYGQMGFTKEYLDERNLILIYIDRRTGQSTTNIKKKLKE